MKWTAPLLILALVLVWPPAPAAAAPPAGIAVVDMVDLITNHPRAKTLQDKLDKEKVTAQAYAEGEQRNLGKLREEIEMMPPNNPQRRLKEKEYLVQAALLKLEIEWRQEQALRDYMDGLETLYTEVQALVARLARERGIGLVLLKDSKPIEAVDTNDYGSKVRLRGVVFYEPAMDITEEVKKLFR